MRKSLLMVGIPVSVIGLGIAAYVGLRPAEKSSNAFATDLATAQTAGIELAQSQGASKFALSETVTEAKPQPSKSIKKGNGPKAVRSPSPTVNAAPTTVPADVVEEIPDLQAIQSSPAPVPAEVVAPTIPSPSPVTEPAPSNNDGPILAGGSGRGPAVRTGDSGAGGGWGGIFGAVIRGGGVDGDNCDLHRNGGRPPMRTPVYGGNPTGMGGGRTATARPTIGIVSSTGGMQGRPRGR